MSPNGTPDKLDVPSEGLSFELQHGDKTIVCTATPGTLRDLGSHHRLTFSEDDIVRVLLPELERLARAKLRAGRLETSGEIGLREADLLRYGFQRAAVPRFSIE